MAKSKQPTETNKFHSATIKTSRQRMVALRKGWQRDVEMYRGKFYDRDRGEDTDANSIRMENNWLFAFVDTLVASVCPTNPRMSIKSNREDRDDPARLREALINEVLIREKMYSKLWKLVARAVVYPRVFMKTGWNAKKMRPFIRIITPEYIFYDAMAEDWEDIRYICEVTVLSKGQFQRRIKKTGLSDEANAKQGRFYRKDAMENAVFGQYPKWILDADNNKSDGDPDDAMVVQANYQWTTVYEYHDLVEDKFYHYLDDDEMPLVVDELPYEHVRNPYMLLSFNDNLQDLSGISDAEIVYPTIARLNDAMSTILWHAKANIPITLVHGGLVDDDGELMDALEDASGPGAMVTVKARPNVSLAEVIGQTPTPNLPMEFGVVVDRLTALIELLLGIASYQRGSVGNGDIATEFALADTAIKTRNARRQKGVHEVEAWAAEAIIGLYMEFLPADSRIPIRIAGGKVTREMLDRENLFLDDDDASPFDYTYEALPYNAAEANSVVQLKSLEQFMEVLLENPNVDQRALTEKLLSLLSMLELLVPEDQVKQVQDMQAKVGAGAGSAEDAAMAAGMPAEATNPMIGGKVDVGTGEQKVEGGQEGGHQGN